MRLLAILYTMFVVLHSGKIGQVRDLSYFSVGYDYVSVWLGEEKKFTQEQKDKLHSLDFFSQWSGGLCGYDTYLVSKKKVKHIRFSQQQ